MMPERFIFWTATPKNIVTKKIQQELIWAYQNLGENDPVIQLYEELIEKYPQIVEII
jgi:hypothetical protein